MTLKLKRTPGLYLVGFMCSGKSTVGRALAEELGWCFVDVDAEIEASQAKSIRQIFREEGERRFRDLETATIREHITKVESGNPCVIALGGGAFVQARNWELIQNNGVTVWLDCTLETVLERLGNDIDRPLATDREGLAQLYGDRRPLYGRADFRLEVDTADTSEIVRRILNLPIF
ncbi:MAG: shikimate kinase [Acidobacteriota bacterium]|nr:shikimate kinase [Acidobacteriota bacterium]